ncbi:MAG: hypothetical protein KA116_11010 [Proteobacteria bacterium]|nr:hypothetical protein [Pseudomonadota bacterium]
MLNFKFKTLTPFILSVLFFTKLSLANSSLAPLNQVQLIEAAQKLRDLEPSQRSLYSKIITESGAENKLLNKTLTSFLCQTFLEPIKLYTNRTLRLAHALSTTSVLSQSFLRLTLLENKSLTEALFELNASDSTQNVNLVSAENLIEDNTKAKFDKATVRDILLNLVNDIKTHDANFPAPLSFMINTYSKDQAGHHITVTIKFPNAELIEMKFNEVNTRGVKAEQWAATLILAAVAHRELLWNPANFQMELNMLSYSLKKLLRVGDAKSIEKARSLIDSIQQNLDLLNTQNPANLSRAFVNYLAIKDVIIEMSQTSMARVAEAQAPKAKDAPADTGNPAVNGNESIPANTEAIPADTTVTNSSNPIQNLQNVAQAQYQTSGFTSPAAWNNIGSRSRRTRYYLPKYRRYRGLYKNGGSPGVSALTQTQVDNSSSTISTIAWFMNPHYMLTHPWFWGVNDNSILAPYLLFSVLQDQRADRFNTNTYLENPNYNPQNFVTPQDPVFFQGNDLPVADPWNAPMRTDLISPNTTAEATQSWTRADGQTVNVDALSTKNEWDAFQGADAKSQWGDNESSTETDPKTGWRSASALEDNGEASPVEVEKETLSDEEAGRFQNDSSDPFGDDDKDDSQSDSGQHS